MAWWLGFGVFTAETQVQALVGGPCYLSHGKAKNTKEKNRWQGGISQYCPWEVPCGQFQAP